jgi:hypothetical protein
MTIAGGSWARVGLTGGITDFHGPNTNTGSAAVRITQSAATLQGVVAEYGGSGAVVVGLGSHDVVIEESDLVNSRGSGVLVQGNPAPTRVTVRDNNIGITDDDPLTGVDVAPVALPNALGVLVEAGQGVTIEDNVVAGNTLADIHVDGRFGVVSDVAIRDNIVGLDDLLPTGGVPKDPNAVPVRSAVGIKVVNLPDVDVSGNTVVATIAEAIRVDALAGGDAAGTAVHDNIAGLPGFGVGTTGILVT